MKLRDFGSHCSEVNVDVKKRALCWTRYMSDNMFVGPGDKAKRNGYPFWTYCFIGNRCSHIEGARHIAIPEVSL